MVIHGGCCACLAFYGGNKCRLLCLPGLLCGFSQKTCFSKKGGKQLRKNMILTSGLLIHTYPWSLTHKYIHTHIRHICIYTYTESGCKLIKLAFLFDATSANQLEETNNHIMKRVYKWQFHFLFLRVWLIAYYRPTIYRQALPNQMWVEGLWQLKHHFWSSVYVPLI